METSAKSNADPVPGKQRLHLTSFQSSPINSLFICFNSAIDSSTQIWELSKNLQRTQAEKSALESDKRQLRDEVAELRVKLAALQESVDKKDQQLKKNEEELKKNEEELKKNQEQLKKNQEELKKKDAEVSLFFENGLKFSFLVSSHCQ